RHPRFSGFGGAPADTEPPSCRIALSCRHRPCCVDDRGAAGHAMGPLDRIARSAGDRRRLCPGDITPLSATVDGYVRNVPVGDFQFVKAGQLLVEIEHDDYCARAAQAYANWLAADAAVSNLKARRDLQNARIDQAQSAIVATQADVERTKQEAARQRNLLAAS